MPSLPSKIILDTNIPIVANSSVSTNDYPLNCVLECIETIEHIIKKGGLVIDSTNEIFDEYKRHLKLKGQPGVGDKFMKWLHDNQYTISKVEQIKITKIENSYEEFPYHKDLESFDISDKKFVAVAHAHPHKPTILQGTDSKWLQWKDALKQLGITVDFICLGYIEATYNKKMKK